MRRNILSTSLVLCLIPTYINCADDNIIGTYIVQTGVSFLSLNEYDDWYNDNETTNNGKSVKN